MNKFKLRRQRLKARLEEVDGQVTSTGIDEGRFVRWQLKRLRRGRSHQPKRAKFK